IIFDKKKNQIIASRDRFGVKPMYILEQDGELFLASEIKQLLPFQKKKEVNREVLSNYLYRYLLDYNEETFFKDIKKLPAMHSLIIDLNTGIKKLEKYWDFSDLDLSNATDEELIIEYKALFESAVAVRLRSDVVVGNTLSGGLDSSSIAVLADRAAKGNFYNYSVISKDKNVSEEKFVDYLIEQNQIKVHKINFDDVNPWASAEKVIYHHDEPILSLSTIAHYKMLEVLKKESDIIVVLSGQGGDESLAGYNKYFFFNIQDLIRQGKYGMALNEMVKILPRLGGEFKLKYAKRYLPFLGKMNANSDVLGQIVKLERPLFEIGSSAAGLKSRQQQDIKQYSVPPLCHYEDRNSMAHSLEIRLPFLDYRLVNYSLNLPNHLKIKNGVNKQILRRSMTELPVEIRHRFDKKGFTIDEKGHQNEEFNKLFKQTFKESALADIGAINIDILKKEFEDIQVNTGKLWERDLHRILFAEIWAKKFL
ncbi:MAG: asparagine synthetase B family protein, partial [Bacteroidia bacterium]